ncbi:group XIIA secretory phospholipase A2-like [Anthonomus grandis grandis]|uniref:group XIIA secretory phospholipase A2-like n=1 Tax=Anthonomus grandis grandis TaxID=2921223 RepID=UPI0021650716|nr:group XIIA secretory phospholipase A2-like [Anthonomus grandis grandis]
MKINYLVYIVILLSICDMARAGFFQRIAEGFKAIGRKLKTAKEVFMALVTEEKCVLTCPSGIYPKKDPNHIPKSNGCGTFGFKIRTGGFFMPAISNWGMQSCCNDHDVCYDTCASNKEICDRQFLFCLLRLCNRGDEDKVRDCRESAIVAAKAVENFGCVSYLYAQKSACVC